MGEVLARQRAVAHLREVLRRVDPGKLLPARRLGLDDIRRLDHARLEKTGANQVVFASGKDVRPDIDVISGRIEDVHRAPGRVQSEPSRVQKNPAYSGS